MNQINKLSDFEVLQTQLENISEKIRKLNDQKELILSVMRHNETSLKDKVICLHKLGYNNSKIVRDLGCKKSIVSTYVNNYKTEQRIHPDIEVKKWSDVCRGK